MQPLVVIFMGSRGDLKHAQTIVDALTRLGIESVMRVASAHKVPAYVLQLLAGYEADPRPKIYITIAGRSNALSGLIDAQVSAPVIACPPPSDAFGGADIFSSLRMPSGVVPAVILDAENAALLAAKIFGVTDPTIRARVSDVQRQNADKLLHDDAELNPTAVQG